jgi:paraquat-inducible protein B
MFQKRHPALIGGFVLGAIILLFVFLLVLGGQGLFTTKVTYHLYFDKSVKGLNKGAAVMLRGVRVGQVADIRLAPHDNDRTSGTISWPILVEVDIVPAAFEIAGAEAGAPDSALAELRRTSLQHLKSRQRLDSWISHMVLHEGLRAQLQSLSLLTGQLYIELNFFTDELAENTLRENLKRRVIPTRMSAFERLFLSLSQKEFGDQVDAFHLATATLSQFIKSGQADQLLANVFAISNNLKYLSGNLNTSLPLITGQAHDAMTKINRVTTTLDERTPQVLDAAEESLRVWNANIETLAIKLGETMANMNQLIARLDHVTNLEEGPGAEVLQELRTTLGAAQKSLADFSELTTRAKGSFDQDSPMRRNMQNALAEIEAAAKSFRALAELLQRKPEALIRGK